MRKLLRGFVWLIKATLLLACIGSVYLWWHSYRSYDRITWTKYYESAREVRRYRVFVDSSDGRFVFLWVRSIAGSGPRLDSYRDWAGRAAGKSIWYHDLWNSFTDRGRWNHPSYKRFGPVIWKTETEHDPGMSGDSGQIGIAYWPLTPLLGVWPVMSLALCLHRRARIRRRRRTGHCEFCGYDLRATPSQGGALLECCPECGRGTLAMV